LFGKKNALISAVGKLHMLYGWAAGNRVGVWVIFCTCKRLPQELVLHSILSAYCKKSKVCTVFIVSATHM